MSGAFFVDQKDQSNWLEFDNLFVVIGIVLKEVAEGRDHDWQFCV